ncbi:STN domain-containing protein [Niastella vici]|nr:STN domain-containing protein [Niastella vici]
MITLRGALSTIIVLICVTSNIIAQALLDRRISIDVTNQRFSDVLKLISSRGNFYFSYNSSIIARDSLISISASNRPVKQVLDQLLGNQYQWQQSNNYIILRKAPLTAPVMIASATPSAEKLYTVTGFVLNGETGEKVGNVTIYEKERLVSTMSDDKGFFKIRLKSRYSTASLTISREMFEDTTVVIQPKYNQQVTIVMTPVVASGPIVTISPVDNELPDTIVVKPPTEPFAAASLSKEEINRVEKTRWGKRLLSAKQNIQSINLKKFFADRTFQVSLTPGLSTHGKLSAQVVNNFSVNMVGGYTAGVSGVELAGAFNINKKDVKYMQAAGALNVTGGSVTGVQLAGFHNHVLGNVDGVQASGFSNYVKGNVTGVQASSFHNHVSGSLKGIQASNFSNFIKGNLVGIQVSNFYNICYDSVFGVQAATIANFAHEQVSGMQASVIANIAHQELNGVQIATIFNYAKKLRGVQIGLINVSDTSAGYSIGLVNIVFKGIHKLMFSTNEVIDYNVAFKTGNKKLYSILLGGYSERKDTASFYTFGYGLGHEFSIGKMFSINPEFTTQTLHQGNWDNTNIMNKLHLQFNLKLGKFVTLFAGPSFTMYFSDVKKGASTIPPPLPNSYHTFDLWDNNVKGWFGWNAGIGFF